MNTNIINLCDRIQDSLDLLNCETINLDTFDDLCDKYCDDERLVLILRSYKSDKSMLTKLWNRLHDVKSAIEFLD